MVTRGTRNPRKREEKKDAISIVILAIKMRWRAATSYISKRYKRKKKN